MKNEPFYSRKDLIFLTTGFIVIFSPFLNKEPWPLGFSAVIAFWGFLWVFKIFSVEIWPMVEPSVSWIWRTTPRTPFNNEVEAKAAKITLVALMFEPGDRVIIKFMVDKEIREFQTTLRILQDINVLDTENIYKLIKNFRP